MLGRKQSVSHEDFVAAMARIATIVPKPDLDALIQRTVNEVRATVAGKRVAFAWSGGKDSIALEHVCRVAGVAECVLVITDLEYPAFLRWVTNHMPPRLTTISTGQDLAWLDAHPDMLFPKDADTAGKWFRLVQHTGQERYYKQQGLDMLLLGRRRADGNYVGAGGVYTSRGVTRYSPIRDWRHEDVLALCHWYGKPLPPCYGWPRGYRVGTGPWPARQWTNSEDHGFQEVWLIDPSVIRAAAPTFKPARDFMARHGLK